MFEKIKNLFKREEPKRDPRVSYVEVDRVPIKRFEPKKFEPKKVKTIRSERLLRIRYTDTNEVKEMVPHDAIEEIMVSMRPVIIEGFVE